MTERNIPHLIQQLTAHSGASAVFVLSTCNRTEIYLGAPAGLVPESLHAHVVEYLCLGDTRLASALWVLTGRDAVHHLMRGAAGLESAILGEPQVLGQIRRAYRLAREADGLDSQMDAVVRAAITCGKQVRTETAISAHGPGIGEVAVDRIADLLGFLDGATAAVVGSGTVGAHVRASLLAAGATVVSYGRRAGRRADGVVVEPVASLVSGCSRFTCVISATSAVEYVVHKEQVAQMQRERGGRPLLLMDLAVPRDIEPASAQVQGVTLLDIDSVGTGGEGLSCKELALCDRIAMDAADGVMALLKSRERVAPVVSALVEKAELLRQQEIERTFGGADLAPGLKAQIDVLTRSIVRKLLHDPVMYVKGDPASGRVASDRSLEELRQLFGLQPDLVRTGTDASE